MSFQSVSQVTLSNPSQQIARLCKHMGHKIPTEFTETEGKLTFDFGVCELSADAETLTMRCNADSQESLAQMQDIMGRHLEQLAWKDEPKVVWQSA